MEAVLGGRAGARGRVELHYLVAVVVLVGASLGRRDQRAGCYSDPKQAAQLKVAIVGDGIVFSSNRLNGMLGRSGSINCRSNDGPYPRPECQEAVTGTYSHERCPCFASWDGEVPNGGEVLLTADADPGSKFDHWEEGGDGDATCVPSGASISPVIRTTLLVGTKVSCRAIFVPDPIALESLITSVNPDRAVVGTTVVISGQHLDPQSLVTFNGVEAPVMSSSETQIVTQVPEGATTGPLEVIGNTGVLEYPIFAVADPLSGTCSGGLTAGELTLSPTTATGSNSGTTPIAVTFTFPVTNDNAMAATINGATIRWGNSSLCMHTETTPVISPMVIAPGTTSLTIQQTLTVLTTPNAVSQCQFAPTITLDTSCGSLFGQVTSSRLTVTYPTM